VERTRVLIVDDHPLFRQGLCWALRTERDFEIVGEAGSGQEALRLARELAPDMVLCDVRLPDVTGVDVARRLKLQRPNLPVVVMSAYDDEDQLFEAARVGAAGFFLKDTTPAPLLDGLRRAARGESLIEDRALQQPVLASHKNHITSILRKLAVNDRTQAVVFALRQGWIRVGNA
jgi:DNA-binding NarL/FixJ family response regulator